MDEEKDFPYMAEYAKSNRASCKGCMSLIAKDSLRVALMVQSRHFDGKQPQWHHFSCFFRKCRPNSIDEIGHFHNLRWEDQERLKTQVERPGSSKEGKGPVIKSLKDFVVQYALSSRSKCRKCDEKIEKDEIRISHKEIHEEKPQLGMVDRWHHAGCFMRRRKELGWRDGEFTAEMISGFKGLDKEDKAAIVKLINKKGKKAKKGKIEVDGIKKEENQKNDQLNSKLKVQSTLMWKTKDHIKKLELKKDELISILEANNQAIPVGVDKILDRIVDGMLFGQLQPCTLCGGQLVASSRGFYQCVGNISGWTSCTNTTLDVKRIPWEFPEELKEESPYLLKYKFKAKDRIFPAAAAPKPLKGKKIGLLGKLSKNREDYKDMIEKMGGTVTTSTKQAYCFVTNKDEIGKNKKKMTSIELEDIFVVGEEFLEECSQMKSQQSSLLALLKKFSLVSWGTERLGGSSALKRMMEEEKKSGSGMEKKMRLTVKDGAAVDPSSGMEEKCKVYAKGAQKYTATLAMVDMKSGANSYYKLQLLESSSGKTWTIFRSWGRVGTNIGGTKLEDFRSVSSALDNFHEVYLEKTGNEFGTSFFEKKPRKFYPLEIDYGEDDENKIENLNDAGSNSKLEKPIQELIKMIFDVESMKKAMMEFEIDLSKMPLGKLSRRQMQAAYSVLTEASELIEGGEVSVGKLLDCSNRFYTLIPHDYGMQQPPLLDNEDRIKSKVEMLDNLMDIEVAYNLMKVEKKENSQDEEDPLDSNYNKLNCDIQVVSKDSDEYKMVDQYTTLTHASTHDQYTLSIDQLFKINRSGEKSRFRPFQNLPNRQLLWHGSRTTNYAGILSQGLRIAPKEAPVTGYMFGKGLYFADMVSKSANYCGTSNLNPDGLLMLADVALGNMCELTDAKYIRKLPKGKHSVKGIGKTEPSTETHITLQDGVKVPMGKEKLADLSKHNNDTSLLYNEYIVYDVAQVNLKYLIKYKFNYKSLW